VITPHLIFEILTFDPFPLKTIQSEALLSPTNKVVGQNSQGASSHQLALKVARAADGRKGGDILLLDVSAVSYLTDYFVIATGFSKTQVRAIAQAIQAEAEAELQRSPLRVEGVTDSSWVLLDYGDVIAHILLPKERQFYNLEAFWGHAESVDFSPTDLTQG
jgi:ribosome-associated protein